MFGFCDGKGQGFTGIISVWEKNLNKEGRNSKVNQLQGKRKLCHISKGVDNHYKEINDFIACDSGYDDTKKVTLNRITNKSLLFKK